MSYESIIGLEVHIELATKSKMFCGCPADHFGKIPNTQTCPVCLGLPGALPVPNKKAVDWTLMLGLALNCTINEESKFDRKNYFYPDLPKGYQISQYDQPFGVNGEITISTNQPIKKKKIRIRRVHLEEDTGKLQHAVVDGERVSLIDFNRSGVALVEVVTEPDFRNIEEVDVFLKKLQQIVRYLGISGADMEKGSMRLEPSISMRITGETKLPPYRVELKNINSFRFARKGLEYEIKRQTEILESGEKLIQQTRGWNEGKAATVPQREKEEANDYRYFPEPDIPPMHISSEQVINIKNQIGEMPDAKITRFIKDYSLGEYDAGQLTETRERADYFEECLKVSKEPSYKNYNTTPKLLANWIINRNIDIDQLLPVDFVKRITSVGVSTISSLQIETEVIKVISENTQAVNEYRSGKVNVINFLLGQVRKNLKGEINNIVVLDLLKKKLESNK